MLARICGASSRANSVSGYSGGPHGPASTNRSTAASYAGSCSVQLVCTPVSRTVFSIAASSRSRSGKPRANAVCHVVHATCGSGARTPALAVASVSLVTSSDHPRGCSLSALTVALTSPLRLVSCVESTVPVSGQSRCSRAQNAWNAAGGSAGCPGSPPTSAAESSGAYR